MRSGAECDHHPQGSVRRRVGPLVPARPSSGLRPVSLLVRAPLVSRAPIGELDDEAACRRPLFLPSLRANGFGPEVAGPIANTARQSSPAREPGNNEPSAYSSSTTPPSRIVTRRSIWEAMSRLWVAIMAASPEARTNWLIVANTRWDVR